MNKTISTSAKKKFIRWFLPNFQLKKKESAWLFSYILSNDRLIEKLHFVNNLDNIDGRKMMISCVCSDKKAFKFYKDGRVLSDVEKAFHDIRIYSDEELFICLNFNNKMSYEEYTSVLEFNGADKVEKVKYFSILDIMSEIILDKAIRKRKLDSLYEEINKSLQNGDKDRFMELSAEWNELNKLDKLD